MQNCHGAEMFGARHVSAARTAGRSAARKGTLYGLLLGSLAGFVGMGFLHPFGDPRAGRQKDLGSALLAAKVPAQTRAVLIAKCADCHSEQTRWPFYARVAPGSWLIEWDVMEGRRHLDLSHLDELTPDGLELLAAKVAQQVRSGKMPPLQYLALHWNARLSSADVRALSAMYVSDPDESDNGAGDPVRGKAIFQKRCTGCHSMTANRDGPKLGGISSRKAGVIPGFDYSPALKKSGIVWNDQALDTWLSDPDRMVPGTTMELRVSKAEDRRDLISYLKQ